MKRVIVVAAVLSLSVCTGANAAPVLISTGDLGVNVIQDAGNFLFQPVVDAPTGLGPDVLTVKYGLYSSPDVAVDVFVNGALVGGFLANLGYISPGPAFFSADVTGLLVPGVNSVLLQGVATPGAMAGDYVIGQIDLTYDSATAAVVPEPTTLALLGTGLLASVLRRRRPRR